MKKDNNKEISSTPSGKLTRPQDYMRINKQQEEKPGVLTPKSLKNFWGYFIYGRNRHLDRQPYW